MYIHVIGTNFKRASLKHVGLVQWAEKELIHWFLEEASDRFGLAEVFFLQTCNRREFYIVAPYLDRGQVLLNNFLDYLGASLEVTLQPEHFYYKHDREAIFHMFRVASSLDSMVLGETEIIRQIKDQSTAAASCGHLGRHLKSLVDVALWTSKQVRHHTHITKNVVSMASLAHRQVLEHTRATRTPRVAFVGAGHFIQSLMPTFAKSSNLDFVFVNRSLPRELAETYGGEAVLLADFLAQPGPFDAVISATGAAKALFDQAWMNRHGAGTLVMDAALPHDIEAGPEQTRNFWYQDLNQMEAVLAENRAARKAEIPKAEPIFAEGLSRLETRWLEFSLAEYHQEISCHYRRVGERALSHLFKDQLNGLSEAEEDKLRSWTESLVSKLTTVPILGLKGVARELGTPAVDAYTKSVADGSGLFRRQGS